MEILLTDITESIKVKGNSQGDSVTLLRFTSEGIFPVYAQEILATYLLMEWPLYPSHPEILRCYAALLPHGRTHVVEIFFLQQPLDAHFTGEYIGTTQIFSVTFPNNKYNSNLDDSLSELLWHQISDRPRD